MPKLTIQNKSIPTHISRSFLSGPTNAANAHYARVIADGGVIESYDNLLAATNALFAIYGVSDLGTAMGPCIDASIFGYKVGTGSGTTLNGWATQKLYSLTGSASDVVQNTVAAQPLLLRWNTADGNYGFLPGVTANFFSTPDSATLDITGDISLSMDVELQSSMLAADHTLFGKANGAGQISYYLGVATGGFLSLTVSVDGTTLITYTSTVAAFSATGRTSIAAFRNATTGAVTFYISPSISAPWTQLGAVVAGTAGNIFVSTANLVVGGIQNAIDTTPLKYYGAQVHTGNVASGGTRVAYFQPSLYNISVSQATFTAVTGEVWTNNRGTATSGYKSQFVFRTTSQGDLTDDTLNSTFGITQPFSAIVVGSLLTWTGSRSMVGGQGGGNAFFIFTSGVSPNASATGMGNIAYTGHALSRLNIYRAIFNGVSSMAQLNAAAVVNGTMNANMTNFNAFGVGGGQSNSVVNTAIVQRSTNSTTLASLYTLVAGWNNNPI